MFYSVLAAADDGRRPWAHPAKHTHTKTLSLSQDTQNHSVVVYNKWMHRCNREKKKIHVMGRRMVVELETQCPQKSMFLIRIFLSICVKTVLRVMLFQRKMWLVFDTISERHGTRPLSVKDWLTLTQHTPGSTRLPPRFKMATRGSPVCLPATMALFNFAAPSSFPFFPLSRRKKSPRGIAPPFFF